MASFSFNFNKRRTDKLNKGIVRRMVFESCCANMCAYVTRNLCDRLALHKMDLGT